MVTMKSNAPRRTTSDKTPPTGKWVGRTPNADDTVSGTVYLELLAYDNRAMNYVQFRVNGEDAGQGTLGSATARGGVYSLAVNTKAFPNGTYNISAYLNALEGPGMTKNLGAVTFTNESRPSIEIINLTAGQTVNLPFEVLVQVNPDGETYDTPQLSGDGSIESEPVNLGGDLWRFPVTEWFEDNLVNVPLTPLVTLGGSRQITGGTVTVINGDLYGDVSVTFGISDNSVTVGETVTFTPTITGDSNAVLIRYDFNDDLSFDDSRTGASVGDAVSYAYSLPGTYTPRVVVSRLDVSLQDEELSPITVSPVVASDTIAPAISVASPSAGATISGTVSYTYSVSDAVGVSTVVPKINGINQAGIVLSPAQTSATVTATLNSTAYTDGALTISGTAYDAAGNSTAAANVVVTVDNVSDPPPPDPTGDWYEWPVAPTVTNTSRNISGSSKANAPIFFMMTYNPGEVTTAHTLRLLDPSSNIVPTTDWQWGHRTTHPDGSLASCWVACYGPASLADNASIQHTVQVIAGSWPAETDSQVVGNVTANSDFVIELSDITEPQNAPGGIFRFAQAAYANPTLEYRNNRALVRSFVPTKITGGAIMTEWYTWEWLKTPAGASDTQVLCKCWTRIWRAPGTNTVRHISVHPLIFNGTGNVFGYAKIAKIRLLNNGSQFHTYSSTLDRTVSDFKFTDFRNYFTDHLTDFTTFKFRAGDAVKISGSPPSGIVNGNFYSVAYHDVGPVATGVNGTENNQRPKLGLRAFGEWNYFGTPNGLPPGTGGGTFTMTSYTFLGDKSVHAIRDGDGLAFYIVGGANVQPYWTQAEKKRRKQTGQIPSIPTEDIGSFNAPWQGLATNYPKNTNAIPAYRHLHDFAPARNLHHRGFLEDSGTASSNGFHLNECSNWMFNVLNDMANTSTHFWKVQAQAGAEAISHQLINTLQTELDANGVEIMKIPVFNNGPNKNGAKYPGLGACWPNLSLETFSINGVVDAPGAAVSSRQQNEMTNAVVRERTGGHSTKEFCFSYVLRGDPSDLEAINGFTSSTLGRFFHQTHPLTGRNKTIGSTTYYNILMLGTGNVPDGKPRCWIGTMVGLSHSLYTPNVYPEAQYFKDIAADNVNFMAAAYSDPTIMGNRAKIVGPLWSLPGGANQGWMMGRHAQIATTLLKRSGHTGTGPENVLKWLTAMARMIMGTPEGGGTPHKQAEGGMWSGYTGFGAIPLMFDNVLPGMNNTSTDTDPRNCAYRFMDAASTGSDSSNVVFGGPDNGVAFSFEPTGNTVVVNWVLASSVPSNGDAIFVTTANTSGVPPSSIARQTWYYLYNKTLVSGLSYRFNLSSTFPAITPVTWTAGTSGSTHRNDAFTRHANRITTGKAGNLYPLHENSAEYVLESTGSIPTAYTYFGAKHMDTTVASWRAFKSFVQSGQGGNLMDKAWAQSWAMFEAYNPRDN